MPLQLELFKPIPLWCTIVFLQEYSIPSSYFSFHSGTFSIKPRCSWTRIWCDWNNWNVLLNELLQRDIVAVEAYSDICWRTHVDVRSEQIDGESINVKLLPVSATTDLSGSVNLAKVTDWSDSRSGGSIMSSGHWLNVRVISTSNWWPILCVGCLTHSNRPKSLTFLRLYSPNFLTHDSAIHIRVSTSMSPPILNDCSHSFVRIDNIWLCWMTKLFGGIQSSLKSSPNPFSTSFTPVACLSMSTITLW